MMRRSNSSRPCYQKAPEKRNPKKGKDLIMLDNKSLPGISKEILTTNTLVRSYRTPELEDEFSYESVRIMLQN